MLDGNEYFGEFSGEPVVQAKSNKTGRPTFILQEDFSFTDPNGFVWITPKDWVVDGASIPRFAWSFVGGPLSGRYLHASIIHDRYCDTRERTAHDTHRNFYYGMLAKDVLTTKAKVMYWAVRTFGPSWKLMKKPKKVTKYTGARVVSVMVNQDVVIDTAAPKFSDDQLAKQLENFDSALTLDEIDQLSDILRKESGSEPLL